MSQHFHQHVHPVHRAASEQNAAHHGILIDEARDAILHERSTIESRAEEFFRSAMHNQEIVLAHVQ